MLLVCVVSGIRGVRVGGVSISCARVISGTVRVKDVSGFRNVNCYSSNLPTHNSVQCHPLSNLPTLKRMANHPKSSLLTLKSIAHHPKSS